MAKLKIKKLGYPLWFNILFFCLTILGPIALIMYVGMQVEDTWFRVSFTVISIGVVAWFFIERFIIKGISTKLSAKQTALEHDYSIDVGNKRKIKQLWFQNEQWLALFQMFKIGLYGGLVLLLCAGIEFAVDQIFGAILWVGCMYVVAYALRFMVIITTKGVDNESQDTNTTSGEQ